VQGADDRVDECCRTRVTALTGRGGSGTRSEQQAVGSTPPSAPTRTWSEHPRAACRLETLGFTEVYDYVAGKADWLAHGLPTEGAQAQVPRAHDLARTDVVTARLEEPVGAVGERVARSPYGFALVVAADGTLLGRLRKAALTGDLTGDLMARTEQVMEAGPSTVRADSPLKELTERLGSRRLQTAVVTTPEGRLLGVLRRVDAEQELAGPDTSSA
jgi:CBS domain-containing protein